MLVYHWWLLFKGMIVIAFQDIIMILLHLVLQIHRYISGTSVGWGHQWFLQWTEHIAQGVLHYCFFEDRKGFPWCHLQNIWPAVLSLLYFYNEYQWWSQILMLMLMRHDISTIQLLVFTVSSCWAWKEDMVVMKQVLSCTWCSDSCWECLLVWPTGHPVLLCLVSSNSVHLVLQPLPDTAFHLAELHPS
jgi:hypothetical protein